MCRAGTGWTLPTRPAPPHPGRLYTSFRRLAGAAVTARRFGAAFGLPRRDRTYTTLLMATRLTFGSIAALYGVTNQLIDQAQYSQLVTVVILSALVPTLIAQRFFQPTAEPHEDVGEAVANEDLAVTHHSPTTREIVERNGDHPTGVALHNPAAARRRPPGGTTDP